MNDDQYMALLDVAELNLRDIRDYTEAKISREKSFKGFIKGGIVDRSKLSQRQFSGSKEQADTHVMSREGIIGNLASKSNLLVLTLRYMPPFLF
jgi:hypothetical protein